MRHSQFHSANNLVYMGFILFFSFGSNDFHCMLYDIAQKDTISNSRGKNKTPTTEGRKIHVKFVRLKHRKKKTNFKFVIWNNNIDNDFVFEAFMRKTNWKSLLNYSWKKKNKNKIDFSTELCIFRWFGFNKLEIGSLIDVEEQHVNIIFIFQTKFGENHTKRNETQHNMM